MSDIIRIKRRAAGGAAGAPSSLAAAELAFNEQDQTLYYGAGNSSGQATTVYAIAGPGYINSALNAAGVYVGDTPPASPRVNQLWWDSVGGNLYVYFQDPTGSPQWVIANNAAGQPGPPGPTGPQGPPGAATGIGEAPTDGGIYARQGSTASWFAAMGLAGNQTLTGGFSFAANNIGTASGTLTPNPMLGNYQYLTNNAAFTIAAPTVDCAMDILMTNGASAGGITFSGFTVGANTGDPLTTISAAKFILSIRRINAVATYTIKALQ
jgi:hypothetical protein